MLESEVVIFLMVIFCREFGFTEKGMSQAQLIRSLIEDSMQPSHLAIEDESHQHSGPNTETHFKLTLVTSVFQGQSRVARHRRVYQLLAEPLKTGVHALALHLYTPEEWQKKGEGSPESPRCRGGE